MTNNTLQIDYGWRKFDDEMELKPIGVLVIEDDTNMALSIERELKRVDKISFHVKRAEDLEAGLKYLADGEIQVVILDLMLPDSQGLDTIQTVRSHFPQVPVVVLTGVQDKDLAIQGMKMGVQDYLFKTQLDEDVLLKALRYAVERKRVEKALRACDGRFRMMIEHNADAIIITTKDRHVLFMNSTADALFDHRLQEVLDEYIDFSMRPDSIEKADTIGKANTIGRSDTIREVQISRKDADPTIVEMRATEMEWEGEDAIFITAHDISSQKRIEAELKTTIQDLNHTVKELQKANKKILEQQKAMIKEERLKVLLQMADATANELNQPILELLSGIEHMSGFKTMLRELSDHMDQIEHIGHEVSDIVKKIGKFQDPDMAPQSDIDTLDYFENGLKILSVEDSGIFFNMIRMYLGKDNKGILNQAPSFDAAIKLLDEKQYDLILLDYMIEDGNGLDFIRLMNKRDYEIPVVVITGQGDEMVASQMIQAGAYDYLPKEMVTRESLKKAINSAMGKFLLKKETQMARGKLADMATRDVLTGLYNRRYFMESLEREVSRARRYNSRFVLCMMDLDHFKSINDTYGHPTGDKVLTDVGQMLKTSIRQSDLACRYGGEEFAVILIDTDLNNTEMILGRFKDALETHLFQFDSNEFHLTVSIGLALFDNAESISGSELVNRADQALYRAKKTGRNRIVTYEKQT